MVPNPEDRLSRDETHIYSKCVCSLISALVLGARGKLRPGIVVIQVVFVGLFLISFFFFFFV